MIVIRIELWKGGNPRQRSTLGTLKLQNDQTGNEEVGNYDVTIETEGRTHRNIRLEGFQRQKGFWHLALQAVQQYLRPTVTFTGQGRHGPPQG